MSEPIPSRIPLSQGEHLIFQTSPHWAIFFAPTGVLCMGGILAATSKAGEFSISGYLFFAGFLWMLGALIEYKTSVAIVTSHRIYARWRRGLFWLRSSHIDMRIKQVESTKLESSLMGHILSWFGHGFGTILVKGCGSGIVAIQRVFSPVQFKMSLDEALRIMDDGVRQANLTGKATATAMAYVHGALTCRKCSKVSPAGVAFCGSCGTKLVKECPKCGTVVADTFCGGCGSSIAELEAASNIAF